MTAYRVALSADFLKPDGTPALADFDLAPLKAEPNIEIGYVEAVNDIIPASALDAYDALILFAYQMRRASLPRNGDLASWRVSGLGMILSMSMRSLIPAWHHDHPGGRAATCRRCDPGTDPGSVEQAPDEGPAGEAWR